MESAGNDLRNDQLFGFGEYSLSHKNLVALRYDQQQSRLRQLALDLGWSHGCPIARKLTDPDNTPYGPWAMAQRYSEVNRWFRHIKEHGQRNPFLRRGLTTLTPRLATEPVGYYEPESVPDSHLSHIAPMTGIYGYALPRVLIEYMKETPTRINYPTALQAFRDLAPQAHSLAELLINLSEETVACTKIEPIRVLQHTLAAGVLKEENCQTAYVNLANSMEDTAPNLLRAYVSLSSDQKTKLGIAEIPNSVLSR